MEKVEYPIRLILNSHSGINIIYEKEYCSAGEITIYYDENTTLPNLKKVEFPNNKHCVVFKEGKFSKVYIKRNS